MSAPRPRPEGAVEERPPRAILATLPVLASLVAVVVATLLGALTPVERVVQTGLGSLWPDPPLASDVVLIEIDEEALRELGPPPWSPADWARIAADLQVAGLEQVLLAEPAERLIDPTRHPGPSRSDGRVGARLEVPGAVQVPAPLTARPDLALPDLHILPGLGDAARSPLLCAWARCPTGPPQVTPLDPAEAATLPRIGLGALLQGRLRTAPADRSSVILGFGGGPWASSVAVGPDGTPLPRAEALALSVATLRARAPRPVAPLAVVLPLAALLVLLGALVAHLEPRLPAEAWILVLPMAVGFVAVGLAASGLVLVPITPLALAALLGALAETLRLRARMAGFFRRLGHRLAAAEIGVPRDPEPTPRGLLQQLASLTWNHLPTDRMLYVHHVAGRAEVVGGFGLAEDDLDGPLTAARLATLAARGRCDEVALDGRTALAVAEVPRGGRVLGWWVVAWDTRDAAPDPARLNDLARWVSEQVPPRPVIDPMARLLRTDRQLDALEAALERTDRAARKQRRLLRTAGMPLAIADRAGTIVFQNESFEAIFDGKAPRSLRELVYRAGGSRGLSPLMRRLFEQGAPIQVTWADRGVVVHACAAAEGARAGVLVWVRRRDAVGRDEVSAAK